MPINTASKNPQVTRNNDATTYLSNSPLRTNSRNPATDLPGARKDVALRGADHQFPHHDEPHSNQAGIDDCRWESPGRAKTHPIGTSGVLSEVGHDCGHALQGEPSQS